MILPPDASKDQSNCPPDYYRRENGMLHQKPDASIITTVFSAIELASLESLSKSGLIALIKRLNPDSVRIGLMTKEEIGEAMMHRLAVKALDPAGRETLAAINQWLDREKGRPVTPVAAQVHVKVDEVIDKKQLAREIAFALAIVENEEKTPNGKPLES